MKPIKFLSALSLVGLLVPVTGSAQTLVETHTTAGRGNSDLGFVLMQSEIEYDVDGGGEGEVERRLIGASFSHGVDESIDIYGEVAYIIEAEAEASSDDGDGFLLGVGVKGLLHQDQQFSVVGRGGFRYIDEDYGGSSDATIYEIELGAIASYALTDRSNLYGGIDIYPISEGELDGNFGDTDFERDDFLSVRFGSDIGLGRVSINPEIAFIGEQAFMLRVKFPL